MAIKGWYKTLLLVWAAFGLPSMLLAYGFAGGFSGPPRFWDSSLFEKIELLVMGSFWLSPLLALPLGLRPGNK